MMVRRQRELGLLILALWIGFPMVHYLIQTNAYRKTRANAGCLPGMARIEYAGHPNGHADTDMAGSGPMLSACCCSEGLRCWRWNDL